MDHDRVGSACVCLICRKQLLQLEADPEINKVYHAASKDEYRAKIIELTVDVFRSFFFKIKRLRIGI